MTSLTAIFGSSEEEDRGKSEKLLELYWNRAELKKEFADLRDETFRLKARIKTEQGNTARAEQKLDQLERLLLDPNWVYSVMVFYQLRSLDELVRAKIARFAEQLKQQREKREHCRLLEEWDAKRRVRARALESEIRELRTEAHGLENRLQSERMRFSMMNAFVRFFRKRSIARVLDSIAGDIATTQEREQALSAELAKLHALEGPDTQGLAIGSKRSINLMIVSFAQQLYLHFSDGDLAALAKESGEKSVGSVGYGDKTDCEFILEAIAQVGEALRTSEACAEKLQLRANLLREHAVFSCEDDAVPESGSVACVFDIGADGVVSRKSADLMGENYWDLQKVLSR